MHQHLVWSEPRCLVFASLQGVRRETENRRSQTVVLPGAELDLPPQLSTAALTDIQQRFWVKIENIRYKSAATSAVIVRDF